MTIALYGIPNCDQVKKARAWLDAHAHAHIFHDFKKAGVSPALIQGWLLHRDWGILLNRKGSTWRALPEARKTGIVDASSAAALMLEMPSIIKRPVLAFDGMVEVGFSDQSYQQIFKK